MRSLRARVIFVLALLGLAAATSALVLYPMRMERGSLRAAKLPLNLGQWSGQDSPVEAYVKEILETDDVIQRSYMNPDLSPYPVMLAVVFSADNRRVAHPPEVCYRGGGWEVNARRVVHYEGLPPLVRLIINAGANQKDMVLYCYKAGDQITANYYRQQYNIAINQLRMQATSSALIRFSASIIDNEKDAEQRLVNFIRVMMPEIQDKLRE